MSNTDKRPYTEGIQRKLRNASLRVEAANSEHHSFPIETATNGEEELFSAERFPVNFTKGLPHDKYGIVVKNYPEFVSEINNSILNSNGFKNLRFNGKFSSKSDKKEIKWRGWESPRTGHYHDTQGPDADGVGMAPAPKLGSDELAAEMGEVYLLSIIRDIPFREIADGSGKDPKTGISVNAALESLKKLKLFDDTEIEGLSKQSKRRRAARTVEPDKNYDVDDPQPPIEITSDLIYRGSGPGAKTGPLVSQFMWIGSSETSNNEDQDKTDGSHPSDFAPTDGYISYGSQVIDQRTRGFKPALDYMTNWTQWLDVQNGANFKGLHVFKRERNFIATPRDLATYVRFDALYQAYLNACLLLMGSGFPSQAAFPDRGEDNPRSAFAAFGGPHILSLVTEVATRCLKAARRQKFNYHRRARPEKISGLITLAAAIAAGKLKKPVSLGETTLEESLKTLGKLEPMLENIDHHNQIREKESERLFQSDPSPDWMEKNYLLSMAFPEGSPMHPSYAAGHATVAGGCITMLKSFFETLDSKHNPTPWPAGKLPPVHASNCGKKLDSLGDSTDLTVEGELNKLAANISIARNVAGVHYYSDYYDSLRMGERVAVGILHEQMTMYDEPIKNGKNEGIVFRSFDGDLITIKGGNATQTSIEIIKSNGISISYEDWWKRHL